jgi:cellulose synthase/poly-beta-1,6-N-acetylglucosamine synthase-like glycosyltransferase
LNGWAILLGGFLLYGYFILRTRWGMYRLARFSLLANTQLRPYSVIIAAHNEAKNITPCFEALIQQDYPPELYEIILAADRCSDETVAKAQAFRKEFPNLKILEIHRTPPAVSPKKYALSRAVEAAAHEHLLFLDADVVPGPKHLRAMNRYFAEDTAAVVSLMKFFPPQTFWQKFLMFEKLVSWCIAGAGIGWKRPLIAYGGNWGYTKSAFEKVRGFEEIEYSLSGDDDLLLQKHTANLILWIAGLFYWPALGGLLLKLLGDWLIIRQGKKLFREEFSFPAAILFDFLYLVYNTLIGPLGYIGKVKW